MHLTGLHLKGLYLIGAYLTCVHLIGAHIIRRRRRRETTCCVMAPPFHFQVLTSCSGEPRVIVLVCVSRSIAGDPGERLVGVDAASRITLEAGHETWHGQLISIQHPTIDP
jgi:hypothetical protein